MKMDLTIREIGEKITTAGRLTIKPFCIYGADKPPKGGVPTTSINTCVARAILLMAIRKKPRPLFVGRSSLERCCGGGAAWLGFAPFAPYIKYFVSTGIREFRNGAAEHLRATPEIAEDNMRKVGRIAPLGEIIVIRACSDIEDSGSGVRSVLCFGKSEQIRNLCSLVYFRTEDPFCSVVVPFGPSCASFVTFAAGMAEHFPRGAAIMGPVDPTGNYWFPQGILSLAIPINLARRMAQDLDDSFIMKRPETAYPKRRSKP